MEAPPRSTRGTLTSPPLPTPASSEARALARELGLTATLADVLFRRGYGADDATRRFLDPRLAHLTSPADMADREAAIDRIVHAVRRREPIALFGDYDCDGITSVAILTEVIRALGGEVTPRLAERFSGGYGLSDQAVTGILETSPKLLITCDCGSSDHPRLERIAQHGVDTVVIDHHLVPGEPIPAVAFLNPNRPDCPFPYKHLASCGLALSLAAGLRSKLKPSLDVRMWLDLVAVGTVADVVPLDGDNRALVRAGMRLIQRGGRLGLRSLAQQAGLSLAAGVTSETIAFDLAPRINAPGRLASPMLSLELLLSGSMEIARHRAASIEGARTERRRIQEQMLGEAFSEIEQHGYGRDPAIVLGRRGWHPGVVGIVAAHIAERHGKAAVVIAFDEAGGRGSARAPKGVPVYDLLHASREAPIHFGGHQAAAGVELQEAALQRFRDLFNQAASRHEQEFGPVEIGGPRAEVCLDPADAPFDVVTDLDWLEPCGMGNPKPRVAVLDARVRRARAVRGGHLQVVLETEKRSLLYGFGMVMGARAPELPANLRVNAIGSLRRDTYRGGTAVGMRVDSIEPR